MNKSTSLRRDFEPRNAWNLFNAFTEVHKAVHPHTALRRGEALYGLFDGLAGVNPSLN